MKPLSFAVALLSCLALSPIVAAQTTHTVTVGPGLDFVPSALTIDEGDTVNWVWSGMGHNVIAGTSSANGFFSSGAPVDAPNTFSVTFDTQFLNDNPTATNRYDYFCAPHLGFGMVGTITVVAAPVEPSFERGDCDDDGVISSADAIAGLNYLFLGANSPACINACDINDDSRVDLIDMVVLVSFIFSGGTPPAAPVATCGIDPTVGSLDCLEFNSCP